MSIEKKSKLKGWLERKREQKKEKDLERLKTAIRKKKQILEKLNSEAFLSNKQKIKVTKLEEEIVKMAKMVLKDGKLQKKEEVEQPEGAGVPPQQSLPPIPPPMQEQPQTNPFENAPAPQSVQKDILQREQMLQQQMMQQQQEQAMKYQQEQMIQQHLANAQQEQQMQQQMAQQQAAQQPVQQQAAQQPVQQQAVLKDITVRIEMIDGKPITVSIREDQLENFMRDLSSAVDDAGAFRVGDRYINARHIVTYYNI